MQHRQQQQRTSQVCWTRRGTKASDRLQGYRDATVGENALHGKHYSASGHPVMRAYEHALYNDIPRT